MYTRDYHGEYVINGKDDPAFFFFPHKSNVGMNIVNLQACG